MRSGLNHGEHDTVSRFLSFPDGNMPSTSMQGNDLGDPIAIQVCQPDQTRYVSKEVRYALAIERTKIRKRVIARLSREEEEGLIKHAYRMKGERGLLIKTLFQTGARISEFVNIKVEDVFFE